MADIKANERSILQPRDRAAELYAGEWRRGARDTDNYLFASKQFYHPFISPSRLASEESPREMIRKLNRDADKQKDTVGYDVAVVTPRRIDSVF